MFKQLIKHYASASVEVLARATLEDMVTSATLPNLLIKKRNWLVELNELVKAIQDKKAATLVG